MSEPRNRIKELRLVPARDLHPDPRNWRTHPKAQTSALLGMLDEVGYADAVAARETPDGLVLVDGHARQQIAAPDDLIPTLILDVDEEEAGKLLLTLDPITAMAEGDRARITALIDAARITDQRAEAVLDLLRRDYRLTAADAAPRDVTPPAPAEPITRPGDLWLLDQHKLLCGDATNPDAWRRLMGGDGASCCFTDPPYGVAYAADGFSPIAGDDKQRQELIAFLQAAFEGIRAQLLPAAAVYIWHASATRYEFETAMRRAGLAEIQYLVWVKPALVLGHADYQWQHEPCFYGQAAGGPHPPFYGARTETTAWFVTAWDGDSEDRPIALSPAGVEITTGRDSIYVGDTPPKGKKPTLVHVEHGQAVELVRPADDSDVWLISRDGGKAQHPTQKPVALAARAILNSTLPGQIVIDGFMGSGSTLMAADLLGRRCYGMELAPEYCDVIVGRWEAATGRKAARA